MKNARKTLAGLVVKGGEFVKRNATTLVAGAVTVGGAAVASAQTDATVLATNMTAALSTVGPVAITIAGFFLILRLSKRAGRG